MKKENPPAEGDWIGEIQKCDVAMFAWAWNGGRQRSPREWYERYGIGRHAYAYNKKKGLDGVIPQRPEAIPEPEDVADL